MNVPLDARPVLPVLLIFVLYALIRIILQSKIINALVMAFMIYSTYKAFA
jgi:hypothetical protein